MKITIPYTAKRLRNTLIASFLYWVVFLFNVIGRDEFGYIQWLFLILAILSTIEYFRQRQQQYLILKDGVLKRNDLIARSIHLQEITEIEKYAGDYILKAPNKKLRIDTDYIPDEALKELEDVFEKMPAKKSGS